MPGSATPLEPGPTRLVLKVDVDTRIGLVDGVRRLADIFGEMGVCATFFIAMGPDRSGRALKRLFRPGFLRKQMRSGAVSAYGPATMLYGLVLPAPVIARKAPGLLNRLVNEGHEVGLHGWDHVFWHDRLRGLAPARVRWQLAQAWRLFRDITGFAPASFAAPGWQITGDALLALAEMGISHVSCTRGAFPFRPLVRGRALPMLELPTTMPTADEILGRRGVNEQNLGAELAGLVQEGRLNVFTLHGEVEGRAFSRALADFCQRLKDRRVIFQRLVDAARETARRGVAPVDSIGWSLAPGRAGSIAFQSAALRETRG